jgi:hypothetical protein
MATPCLVNVNGFAPPRLHLDGIIFCDTSDSVSTGSSSNMKSEEKLFRLRLTAYFNALVSTS